MGCTLGNSKAIAGVGTIFQRWDEDTSQWVKLAEVQTFLAQR